MNISFISSTNTSPQKLDQRYLNKLINLQINGKICWQAHLGYGQELCLEIGQKIPYSSPRLQGESKGEWQFGTRASDWSIITAGKRPCFFVKSSEDESIIRSKIEKLNNQVVKGIRIINYSPGYCYCFNLGHYDLLIPDQNNDDGLSLWELFIPEPDRLVLEVFPHLRFQLHSQDESA
ncbi:slr1778 [Synechocystis sp. PCC 6803]|jgi:hypothetical protein|uniref:Slr1778 protein n=1 Tax=Synechocystis sp. (strain ATCC 27184 / PCC 6803 / Kazusa) TaxID=1111708 RepID=P72773_SYNY3|nr:MULTISPECIES: hypothetical protein [unclassified Synechocystis]BAM50495.1 hypothetical protein BEST7613_1564 [Synechocystis sp. PCC 6803] [Bacillus subtilis BEST7613]AGF50477.1 hypothetical protein MYO_12120 [Synechocystis sp. PCC 6803]ALJ66560.1 hypothetical protein AOY38_01080 [Synechocystis sp. PCC 6803]AVP88404.1 hypothetical protein C7I86_01095 [Synechocystis sp. IPPAS B-1465]MBD2617075.1 hypothetical protein [Synechocystis sp. FACHB-898]